MNSIKPVHLSTFTGLGLFDLAALKAGYKNIAQVEKDEYCLKHLEKTYPHVKRYKDITRTDFTQYRHSVDIISGGFPCQPYSQAGERKGDQDERALFGDFLRAVDETQPSWVLGENVFGLLTIDGGETFENMCSSLEDLGYQVQPFIVPASALGAVHRRDRVWILAYSGCAHEARAEVRGKFEKQDSKENAFDAERSAARNGVGNAPHSDSCNEFNLSGEPGEIPSEIAVCSYNSELIADPKGFGLERELLKTRGERTQLYDQFLNGRNRVGRPVWVEAAARLCGMDDGTSVRMDEFKLTKAKHREHRLKALGNGIYWPIAYMFFRFIKQIEEKNNTYSPIKKITFYGN